MDLDFYSLVSSLGFPIVVSIYLLTQFRASLDNLNRNINSLTFEVRTLKDVLMIDTEEFCLRTQKEPKKRGKPPISPPPEYYGT